MYSHYTFDIIFLRIFIKSFILSLFYKKRNKAIPFNPY
ncbi:hypothetical protein BSPA14S_K0006 (plasmid) [Borreliella spielmanii A14S]|uniref:Uncharacterized protein n=1 Tax=Borreliella spielmanii A14S TaxID=498742 RepID=C0RBR6_9SPIR|nr:hypothetical protein BSPA14S_K0006 [Borreliella spielmanii A14S]